MKVLVIGSGGREHAIVWKLKQSAKVSRIYAAPGNPGMASCAQIVPIKVDSLVELAEFARSEGIDLTVIGPEYPLSLGIVDHFREAGLRIFGPTKAAAQLESSKAFAKEIMIEAGVLTSRHAVFEDREAAAQYLAKHGAPVVLKADGLAAGKGVFVCLDMKQAERALDEIYSSYEGTRLVIEDFLQGKEVSYIVATDGKNVVPLASSHDYKRALDGDQGPNTGGMGSVSPTPNMSASQEAEVIERVIEPVLAVMKRRGTPFSGFLYAGLMLTESGIQVLEFNARLGDPETQVILRRLRSDFFEVLYALSEPAGSDQVPPIDWTSQSAVCVVLASEAYPAKPITGDEITGIEAAEALEGVAVFHAGTALDGQGRLVTAGGRVLNVTAVGNTLAEATLTVYRACKLINFRGMQHRSDIAK
ncbi:MAG: phosphoribosylamine--glycine ligase [Deltaproteobacteria bacterium]|nr:phosphoribosylamine--glycine ligase [Deltaproteobacteria bacterium]